MDNSDGDKFQSIQYYRGKIRENVLHDIQKKIRKMENKITI